MEERVTGLSPKVDLDFELEFIVLNKCVRRNKDGKRVGRKWSGGLEENWNETTDARRYRGP